MMTAVCAVSEVTTLSTGVGPPGIPAGLEDGQEEDGEEGRGEVVDLQIHLVPGLRVRRIRAHLNLPAFRSPMSILLCDALPLQRPTKLVMDS